MRNLLLILLIQLITQPIIAQNCMTGNNLSTPAVSYKNALTGTPLDGSKAFFYNWSNGTFLSADLPNYDNIVMHNSIPDGVTIDFNSDGDLICIQTWGGITPAIFRQDFATNTITNIGNVTGIQNTVVGTPVSVALAWDAAYGNLYLLHVNFSVWGSSLSFLYSININTNIATLINQIPGVDACMTLAFNPHDRMLYTIDFYSNQLVKVNPENASSTFIGTLPFTNSDGAFCESDFNDITGELIASIRDETHPNTNIWNIDITDASATLDAVIPNCQLSLAINSTTKPVPFKWYYFLLVFIIPIAIIIRKRLF
jgi:hypothetical protein